MVLAANKSSKEHSPINFKWSLQNYTRLVWKYILKIKSKIQQKLI
jgi:hypothetical protein